MSIRDFFKKGNTETIAFDESGEVRNWSFLRPFFLSLVIILVSTLSYGIGRLSTTSTSEPIKIEYDESLSALQSSASAMNAFEKSAVTESTSDTSVVASSKGTKYHYSYCPGAKQISEKNKITFASAAAAEASGYTLAANCSPR
ncbi:hypothetical protein KW796_03355 [Candidatus Parcubacteria bacterium]|nr:hypothetical protein [Candidatus Parcubacteria bacterium]